MKFWLALVGIVGVMLVIFVLGNNTSSQDNAMDSHRSPSGSLADMVGKPAPDFTLQAYDGKTVTLNRLRGKKVVLFFSEGIMCYPACWNQIAALGSDNQLNNDQVTTASIVPDGKDQWTEAVNKMPELGKESILLDADNSVSSNYGMLDLSSSMHKSSKPGHTYVIVDQKGVVRFTLDDQNMGIQNNKLQAEVAKI